MDTDGDLWYTWWKMRGVSDVKEKKKKLWGGLIVMLISLLGGMGCGLLIGLSAAKQQLEGGAFVLLLLGMLVAIFTVVYLHIAIHEAGHLLFGYLTGHRFASFRLGSFMLVREQGRLRLRRFSIAGTGGQCLMLPPKPVEGQIPYVLYGLGGVIANTVVSAAALVLWLVLPKGGFVSIVLLMAAVFGFVLAFANGFPMLPGAVDNDGRNVLTLRKHPQAMSHYIHQLQINGALGQGLRVKDMPEQWFPQLRTEQIRDSFTAAAAVFYANRLMDQHRFEEAQAWMEELLAANVPLPDLHRKLVRCDLLYLEMIGQQRQDRVRELLTKEQEQFHAVMKTNLSILRTQYAMAVVLDKDPQKAAKKRSQFDKQAQRYPYTCEVDSERELLELVVRSEG